MVQTEDQAVFRLLTEMTKKLAIRGGRWQRRTELNPARRPNTKRKGVTKQRQ
jgi:hypothetical protein